MSIDGAWQDEAGNFIIDTDETVKSVTILTLTKKASEDMKNRIASSLPFYKKTKTKVGKRKQKYQIVSPKILSKE
jgi:ATP-dependent exoDNAse (exonuclease V) beta subunit